jgi:hypothetical protein
MRKTAASLAQSIADGFLAGAAWMFMMWLWSIMPTWEYALILLVASLVAFVAWALLDPDSED